MQRSSHSRYLLQGPLVLASHNQGKIAELQAILPPSLRPVSYTHLDVYKRQI